MFDPTVNAECITDSELSDGNPQTFGIDFEPKGNFTFTYSGAITTAFMAPLCSPHLFVLRELVRRTKYLAIPKFVEPDEIIHINGETIGPYFSTLYRNETELVLLDSPITEAMYSFTSLTPRLDLEPLFSILGGVYPVPQTDTFLGSLKIFDQFIWFSLLFIMIFIPLLLSTQKSIFSTELNVWIRNYGTEIWSLFSTSFLGTPLKKYRFFLSYGSMILMLSILVQAFSSGILFSTIHISYTYIDSIEDLIKRPDLQPLVHFGDERISEIRKRGTEYEIKYLESGLKNTEPSVVSNYATLFSRKKYLIDVIVRQKRNVFISAQSHVRMIETTISETNNKLTHISKHNYLNYLVGYVRNKYSDPLIGHTFDQILYQLQETGCYKKFAHDIIEVASHFFDNDQDEKEEVPIIEEDRIGVKYKIALGPLIIGIQISIFSIFIEKLIDFNDNRKKF